MENNFKMKILKKANKIWKRSVHLLVFINIVCSVSLFSALFFAGRKIQSYLFIMNSYTPLLEGMEKTLAENVNVAELNKVNEALEVLIHSTNMIVWVTIASFILFFLLVCFFQSLEWRLVYRSLKKRVKVEEIFKKHWSYLWRFSLIVLPVFIMIMALLFKFIVNLRSGLLETVYGFDNISQPANYPVLFLSLVLILLLTYFSTIIFILLNKLNMKESIKTAFKLGIKKAKFLFPVHVVGMFLIVPIMFFDAFLSKIIDFRIAVIISLIIYFILLAYYQTLMVLFLEKT